MIFNDYNNSLTTYKRDYGVPVIFLAGEDQGFAVGEKIVFEFIIDEKADKKLIKTFTVDASDYSFSFKFSNAEAERFASAGKRMFNYTVKRHNANNEYLQTLFNSTLTLNSTIELELPQPEIIKTLTANNTKYDVEGFTHVKTEIQGEEIEVSSRPTQYEVLPTGISLISKVTVKPSEPLVEKNANFYDYDGTLVHSYTTDELNELTEYPSFPVHEGLTALRWNWSDLAAVKAYTNKYGKCDVGATYTPSDGNMHLKFLFYSEAETSPTFTVSFRGTLTITPSDGTTPYVRTQEALYPHTVTLKCNPTSYPAIVDYVFSCDGEYNFNGTQFIDSQHLSMLHECNLPESVVGRNMFTNAFALQKVSIANDWVGYGNFYMCEALKALVLPYGSSGVSQNVFWGCTSARKICFPDSLHSIPYSAVSGAHSLRSIIIPDSVDMLYQSAFAGCRSLSSVIIPDSVRYIYQNVFTGCSSLHFVDMTAYSDPSALPEGNSYMFLNCPNDFIISVKNQEIKTALLAKTYWSDYASNIQIEGEQDG